MKRGVLKRRILAILLVLVPALAQAQSDKDSEIDRLQPPPKSSQEAFKWFIDNSKPRVRLHPLPKVAPATEPILTPAQRSHIQDLIHQLATIAEPDYGISPTMSGEAFAPVPGSERADALVLTNHGLHRSPALLELVKIGPRALPALLEHLDDATETKITLTHPDDFGGMGFGSEIHFNPVSPLEEKTRKKRSQPESLSGLFQHTVTTYRVKVGDICYAIIGQIVGRYYLAVRYQPTAIIVINSPVADPMLAQQVREIWTGSTPSQRLFESLLIDYSCRGIYDGYSYDSWGIGSDYQCSAVMRLLYYFPEQAVPLVARRLHDLRVTCAPWTDSDMERWSRGITPPRAMQDLRNGVVAADFVKAVAWCPDPRIQQEIEGIFRRAKDPVILAAVIGRIPPPQRTAYLGLIREYLMRHTRPRTKDDDSGPDILAELAQHWGADALPFLKAYRKRANARGLLEMCWTLNNYPVPGDLSLLQSLLDDKRPVSGTAYKTDNGTRFPRERVCDAAAEALTSHLPYLTFPNTPIYAERDRAIATIKARLRK